MELGTLVDASKTFDRKKTMSQERLRIRVVTICILVVVAGTVAYLGFGKVGTNLVYYWSPEEMHAAGDDAVGASIRLGGLVQAGSIDRNRDGLSLHFTVTDGVDTVRVHSTSVPPAMFREGIGVVIEGTLMGDGTFESSRLMVKHDNEYQAPDNEDNRNMRELMQSLQFGTAGE